VALRKREQSNTLPDTGNKGQVGENRFMVKYINIWLPVGHLCGDIQLQLNIGDVIQFQTRIQQKINNNFNSRSETTSM
jgi:hypothetical protein